MQSVYGRVDSGCLSLFECMLPTDFDNGGLDYLSGPKGDITVTDHNAIVVCLACFQIILLCGLGKRFDSLSF